MSKRRFLISPLAAAATLLAFGAQAQVTVQGFADGAWRVGLHPPRRQTQCLPPPPATGPQ